MAGGHKNGTDAMKINRIGLGLLATFAAATGAVAQPAGEPRDLPVIGVPVPGGVNYQPAVTPVAHDMHWLSNWIHSIMALIVLLVVGLILFVIFRYNSRRNPTPARFTHNTRVEIAWTLVPVVILIIMGSFSLPILFKQLEVPTPDLTVKATGNQWYWSYYYPANDLTFDSLMLAEDELESHGYGPDVHLLATDTAVVVPVDKVVHVQVTGADVIHAWTIPAFGVKIDAVPGRLNETWFQAEEEGIYFGQCSELCGKNHTYMPITVKVVSQDAYDAWLDWAIDEYGGTRPEAPATGAAAAAEPPADTAPAAGEPAGDAPAEQPTTEQPAAVHRANRPQRTNAGSGTASSGRPRHRQPRNRRQRSSPRRTRQQRSRPSKPRPRTSRSRPERSLGETEGPMTDASWAQATATPPRDAEFGDYLELLKPRVMRLVVFTAFVGLVCAPVHVHPVIALASIVCIAVGAGASGALNMWWDSDIDALMARTARRPIPSGRVAREEALAIGVVLASFAVVMLALFANLVAAGLLAFTIFFYAVVYSIWLKRATPQNIVIGGAAGAFPPMIGWAAATGGVAVESFAMFALIFLWTPPHFWALALFRNDDYARAGVPMLPVTAGPKATRNHILGYAAVLAPVAVAPAFSSDRRAGLSRRRADPEPALPARRLGGLAAGRGRGGGGPVPGGEALLRVLDPVPDAALRLLLAEAALRALGAVPAGWPAWF